MKKLSLLFLLLLLFVANTSVSADKDSAIAAYKQELSNMGVGNAEEKAENDVDGLISSMESDQADVKAAYDNMEKQVNALVKTSSRRGLALDALDSAESPVSDFTDLEAEDHIRVQPSVAGAPPYITEDDAFKAAKTAAEAGMMAVRQIMIAPDRPGAVPAGDIVSDFLPQIIRQLFRFAWVAVFVAFTVSGVFLVMAHGDDEKVTKAKGMIYYTLIGFAFVALAFAMVKAITDIDFFRFI